MFPRLAVKQQAADVLSHLHTTGEDRTALENDPKLAIDVTAEKGQISIIGSNCKTKTTSER